MRKKLLRSRSGFEKPESREEAIMQNILGASNVLEPSESNIEEILKSILYDTPYTEEAEFEIEKILLAIKNNGTYDGECESRDLKILFAILNDLDYTEEAESRIEELFIEWLHQRSSIKVLEGVPPLTFTSHGLPLINYLIEGNTVQNGTPTPDNPIQPSETGERTENLCTGYTTPNSQFNIYIENLKAIVDTVRNFTLSFDSEITYAGNTLYLITDGGNIVIGYVAGTGHVVKSFSFNSTQVEAIKSSNNPYIRLYVNGADMSGNTNVMLNTGSTAKPYEPYGYKIPISSANTTTPVYLGEVESTRKIKKLVLTGEESWVLWSSDQPDVERYYYKWRKSAPSDYGLICTHFPLSKEDGNFNHIRLGGSSLEDFVVFISKTIAPTVADFKSYLAQQYAAGTPVTVWYALAEPETGIVNEPLMKIGNYADTLSKEQAGVEIPTASGSNTLDVDTTVKPSNIYIEYK